MYNGVTQHDREILRFIEQYGSITSKQASRIFYQGVSYQYDRARHRLKQLAEFGSLKSSKDRVTNQMVFYLDKKPSLHSIYLMDFYSWLIYYGAEVKEWKVERMYKCKYKSDGYVLFKFNGKLYPYIIEIDLYHKSDLSRYEEVYSSGELQQELKGNFPFIAVVTDSKKLYQSDRIHCIGIDYKYTDFWNKILLLKA